MSLNNCTIDIVDDFEEKNASPEMRKLRVEKGGAKVNFPVLNIAWLIGFVRGFMLKEKGKSFGITDHRRSQNMSGDHISLQLRLKRFLRIGENPLLPQKRSRCHASPQKLENLS